MQIIHHRKAVLDQLWMDYLQQCRYVGTLCYVLHGKGEKVVNDHIAFHTVGDPKVGADQLARSWIGQGYEPADHFEEPTLTVRSYRHADPGLPKLLIRELNLDTLHGRSRDILGRLLAYLPEWRIRQDGFCYAGRQWPLSFSEYRVLAEESEYAAWFAALGLRAHHFALDVGQTTMQLSDLVDVVRLQGIPLDPVVQTAGLHRGRTQADQLQVEFSDGWFEIPGCSYEFVQRLPVDGELFQGFSPNAGVQPAH